MYISEIDIRDAVFDQVYALGSSDRNVIMLTDDMDAFSLRKFQKDLPDQYINVGVAEQNMINVAAGLATCGKRVFAYGIASYVTMRCFEQIKVNICSMNLPVTIIGVGTGYSFDFDGPTHHGTQDVSVMRSLPEMTIYNPSDITFASNCVTMAYQNPGPVYIRLDKGRFPVLSDQSTDFAKGYRIVKPLEELNILTSGFMTPQTLKAAETLEQNGTKVGVVDLYRLKPIDAGLYNDVLNHSLEIITIEESSIIGGIGTIVAEILADQRSHTNLTRIAVPDRQLLDYGSREWFHEQTRLDIPSLIDQIASVAHRLSK